MSLKVKVVRYRNILWLLLLSICFPAVPKAQKVTLNFAQEKLVNILPAVTRQTGLTFTYSSTVVDLSQEVSIKVRNAKIEEALEQLFVNTGIMFEISNRKIYLIARESKPVSRENKKRIWGVVTDETGEPLPFANITEKDTQNRTVTSETGEYRLIVSPSAIVGATFMGYSPQEIQIGDGDNINFVLKENSMLLGEVVATALGIPKREKSLTYAVQQIKGEILQSVHHFSLINALSGKSAGVIVNQSSSGLGGSSKVTIRGGRSLSGNNQPLYIIDGIPVSNASYEQPLTILGGFNDGGARDSGDGIVNINADDVESLNILKGPAAAALYGTDAANGVILINTKRGKKGAAQVEYSSGISFENALQCIEFQNEYFGGWGERMQAGDKKYDNRFFKTSALYYNSLSLSSGSEQWQTYISYANNTGNGIIPNHKLTRHNVNFKEDAAFFDNRLRMQINVGLINQKTENKPVAGGYYLNPLVGVYRFSPDLDLNVYKGGGMKIWNSERSLYEQNWIVGDDKNQNPYWLTEMIPSDEKRNRIISSLTASLKLTEKLEIQARGSIDYMSDRFQQKMYAGTHNAIAKGDNGRYIRYWGEQMLSYGDIMLTWSPVGNEKFSFEAVVGASIKDEVVRYERLDSNPGGLKFANIFTTANILAGEAPTMDVVDNHIQMQSVFGTLQLGLRNAVFCDITARNDWSSTLAFTNNMSFFYPSAGISVIVSDLLKLPQWISYAKIRSALSWVGNTVPIYSSRTSGKIILNGGTPLDSENEPFETLKPEKTFAREAGIEMKLFGNRIFGDVTIYKTNTLNQYLLVPAPAGSGYAYRGINGGDIENKGIEAVIGATPLMTRKFSWRTDFNFALNRNKIITLHKDLPTFVLGNKTPTGNYQMRVENGGSIGDIYGVTFKRDENGEIQYDSETNLPLKNTENFEKVGNSLPKWNLGWNNMISWGDFSLSFLIDMRFGGQMLSMTQSDLDYRSATKAVAGDRNRGYALLEGHKIEDVKGFYQTVVGSDYGVGVTEYYMQDATNIRVREAVLAYKFGADYFQKAKFIKGINVSLAAKNLFFIYRKTPFDPDAVYSIGNDLQGVDVFGIPSTRSWSFSLRVIM